jgi:subfamily B ATP-binding cassette protein MsbA
MKLENTTSANSFRYGWLIGRVFPFIRPFLGRALLGLLVAIPVGMLDGVVAFALKPYMDYVVGQKDLVFTLCHHTFSISWSAMAMAIPFAVVFFALFQGVLRYLNEYLTDWTSQKITNTIKIALFNKLVYMDTSFYDENTSGVILTRYLSDTDTASTGIVNNIKSLVTSFFGAISLIAVMLYSSWRLAVIGVVVLCIAFVPVAIIRKRIKATSNKNMVIGGNIMTNFNETYSGNRVMRAYCLEERQKFKFQDQIWKSFANNMSLVKRSGWMSPLMYLIASIGIALVLWYGTHLITSGYMTAGSLASFVTSLLLLYKPIKTLGNTLTGLQTIFVAMGRVFELFDIEPEICNSKNAVELQDLTDSIEFKNVNFEYVKDTPVLKNISLSVKKGETLAIVGNSGGGKSTVVNLIPRFYDVNSGSITLDGKDIREYTMKSLRENISMVFQDNFLFSGTIRENIMMGNANATEAELNQAIESAHLEEMIADLPDGLDTELGERGTTLSGGQRQRVAIARAMIKNSPIVILDEATSALDNKSEAIVQKALDNLIQNKTVFVIAHRLSTIKNADRIAVINEGELVELGTHDELMNIEGGQYRALYDMQFKKQEVEI